MPDHASAGTADRLGFAMFLAVAVHALLIFGVAFTSHVAKQPPPTLDITLSRYADVNSPDEADFLAENNQQGSGDQQQKKEVTTTKKAKQQDTDINNAGAPQQQQEQLAESGGAQVITSNQPGAQQSKQETKAQTGSTAPLPPALMAEFKSLQAKLAQQEQIYSKIPKTLRLTSASTKATDHAAYMLYWIERIEVIGNENYPEEARRKKIYGDLRMAVTLLPDGSVFDVEILSSSGQRVLDQAAVRIVRLAAPYGAFPKALQKWDRLEIIRTWRFEPGNIISTSDQ